LALAQQTIATARSNWKQLPKNVQGAIVKAEEGVVELRATLRAQSNASDGVLRQADLRIDRAWSALVDHFTGLTKLVDRIRCTSDVLPPRRVTPEDRTRGDALSPAAASLQPAAA
jgi:hypothetical protein